MRKRFGILTVVALGGLTACSDSTAIEAGVLTAAESEELAGAVMVAVFSTSGTVPQPAQAGLAMVTWAAEIDDILPCMGGGTVDVAASAQVEFDQQSGDAQIQWSMTQIHDGCVVTGTNGQTFTLTGAPSMNVAITVNSTTLGTEWGGSVQGDVDWVTDGRTGSCMVNMEFNGSSTPLQSVSAQIVGNVCGFAINHSFVVTP